MSLKLTILGCHSATPRVEAHPSAQILQIKNHNFLIDCGEGTQVQIRKYKISYAKIKHIFISHLHGDHYFGLIGLIATFGLLNREKDLHIYGPKGLQEIIELQMRLSLSRKNFSIYFHELKSKKSELIFEDKNVTVHTIPLKHRIYTNGFLFKEKLSLRKLNINTIEENKEIQTCDYYNLKKGKDFVMEDGTVIKNELLTFPPREQLSYAYCSDTSFNPKIASIIKNCNLLYHESTFLSDREQLADKTGHSTAYQAGKIAEKANVKILLLGHYSNRYRDLSLFQKEALNAFKHTLLAIEGRTFEVE